MRGLRWIGGSLLALTVVWLIGAAWVRLSGPDARQRAALAVLEEPIGPVAGRDLAEVAWLLPHIVPAESRAEVLDALRGRANRDYALRLEGRIAEADALADPLDAFPRYPEILDDQALCEPWATDCLAHVRSQPEATQASIEANRPALDAMLGLAEFDGFRVGMPQHALSTISAFGHRRLVPTHFAVRFALGERTAALSGLCRDLSGWRRIGADNDHLITSMIATAYVRQDLRLLGEFVGAMPADEAIPATCIEAIATGGASESSLCGPMRGEFAYMRAAYRLGQADPANEDRFIRMLYSPERMDALMAPHYAFYCSADAVAQEAADKPHVMPKAHQVHCPRWEFVFDPVDCILAEIAGGAELGKYPDRRTDMVAELALARTALWLRETDADPRPRAQRLKARPATLGLRRTATLDMDGSILSIPLIEQARGTYFRFPLPAPGAAVEASSQMGR